MDKYNEYQITNRSLFQLGQSESPLENSFGNWHECNKSHKDWHMQKHNQKIGWFYE